jgi:uncharacterized protein YjiS (DUF1127 family)
MSYTTATTATPSFDVTAKLRSMAEGYRAHRADMRAARQTFNELSAMTDRDLADIGIARSEIRHIASQTVAQR